MPRARSHSGRAPLTSSWVLRDRLGGIAGVPIGALAALSTAGGLAGAILLLSTPAVAFNRLVPWLLLTATLTFTFGARAGLVLRRRFRIGRAPLLAAQFVLGVYGGYFGGAVGIMMLAVWGLLSGTELVRLHALRVALVGVTNSVAVLCFVAAGAVWWPQTLVMLVGAAAGGYLGAQIGRRMSPRVLRISVSVFMVVMTGVFFWRAW